MERFKDCEGRDLCIGDKVTITASCGYVTTGWVCKINPKSVEVLHNWEGFYIISRKFSAALAPPGILPKETHQLFLEGASKAVDFPKCMENANQKNLREFWELAAYEGGLKW